MTNKFSPSKVLIFQEADGWHFCPKNGSVADARGKGYPSQAAAWKAARAAHQSRVDAGLISQYSR